MIKEIKKMKPNEDNKIEEIKKIIETELKNKSLNELIYKYNGNMPHSNIGPEKIEEDK